MPSAPSAFSFPIISQKHFSSSTVSYPAPAFLCQRHHRGALHARKYRAQSHPVSLFGAFISTYFLSSAVFTASIRNNSSLNISCFSSLRFLLPISRASDFITTSTSFKRLLTSVEPELTISKMASARPMPGATSHRPRNDVYLRNDPILFQKAGKDTRIRCRNSSRETTSPPDTQYPSAWQETDGIC